MNRFFRHAALSFLLLLLVGCSTVPDTLAPEAGRQIKKVAVVSTIGDVFIRSYIGVTVFGNEIHRREVADWGLDGQYQAQIAAELRKASVMVVVDATAPQGAFSKVNQGSFPEWRAIQAPIQSLCTANALDGVFVVAKRGDRGIGIYASRHPQYRGASLLITAQLALFDCRTGLPVVERPVAKGLPQGMFNNKLNVPGMSLPEGWPWYGEWTPKVYDDARAELVRLPADAWADTVKFMLSPARYRRPPR